MNGYRGKLRGVILTESVLGENVSLIKTVVYWIPQSRYDPSILLAGSSRQLLTKQAEPLMSQTNTLSVVLIAKNSSATLESSLNSVQWADEIILWDSGSTDDTVEIATRCDAKVYQHTDWIDS